MPAQVLYRKWRPQTFDQLVAQEHVVRTLRNALAAGRVSHAYLFAGPRGTGKTSVARILAKAVNCLADEGERPCNECHICRSIIESRSLDLIEIDAASNRGIDEIRDLREKVNFSPSEARYKIYIVDEVHMLTNEAFNALLKTLEEPPGHAIFVLATTEPHKIPATVLSRCQRFDFRRIPLADIVDSLTRIGEAEGLKIEEGALELIGRQATGSLRDAISLLDQLVAHGNQTITLAQVQTVLGIAPDQAVQDLVTYLLNRDLSAGLTLISRVIDEGMDPRQFNHQVLEHLRGLLLLRTGGDQALDLTSELLAAMREQAQTVGMRRLIETIKLFNQANYKLRGETQLQLPLELAFVESALMGGNGAEVVEPLSVEEEPEPASEKRDDAVEAAEGEAAQEPAEAEETPEKPASVEPTQVRERAPTAERDPLAELEARWDGILDEIRARNATVQALLKSCKPAAVEEDTVVLGFFYEFHKKRIQESEARILVQDVLSEMLGQSYQIRCILTPRDREEEEKERPKDKFQTAAEDPVVKAALEKGARIVDVEETD